MSGSGPKQRGDGKMFPYPEAVLAFAREYAKQPIYTFSPLEKRVLERFFTNPDKRVFVMFGLPPNVGASLLALYSRMEAPRGLRGIFVDTFVPQLLATGFPEVEVRHEADGTDNPLVEKYLKDRGIDSLEKFANHRPEARAALKQFIEETTSPEWWKKLSEAKRTKRLLSIFLDKYGHNSIARGAGSYICYEKITLQAAKSSEWTRPAAAYIERSTRYTNNSGSDVYPLAELIRAGWDVDIENGFDLEFAEIRKLQGDNYDGSLPDFFRKRYAAQLSEADLKAGVIGETCDVVGNLLPFATLTSVGIFISGESIPQHLKHLILDGTPENLALVEMTLEELAKIGADQFARYYKPTEWDVAHWQYLSDPSFGFGKAWKRSGHAELFAGGLGLASDGLLALQFGIKDPKLAGMSIRAICDEFAGWPRGRHDKLPSEFEVITLPFWGKMTIRGWRDLQRQGFSTHNRTHVTPELGFYEYDKPAPSKLEESFRRVYEHNKRTWAKLMAAGVPLAIAEQSMAMGNLVGFTISGNLRQLEFCNWQRSDWNVNHEVRRVFLSIEHELRKLFPWWEKVSRADLTDTFVFARGNTPLVMPKD